MRVGFVEIVLSNLILMMVSHKQKLSIPYQDSEPAVATTPGIPDISIRHTPPLRGGFSELQKKGLWIKDYHTTEKE